MRFDLKNPPRMPFLDLITTITLAVTTLGLHAWQTLGLESTVGQFSKYPLAASQFLNDSLTNDRLFDFSPTYLWLCSFIAHASNQPFQALYWLQLTLVALTAASFFLLLRHYFNYYLSLLGTAAFSLNPSIVVYAYIFEPEPLMLFLLSTTVLLAHYHAHLPRAVAGLTILLCILTRPVHILLVAAIPLFDYLRPTTRRRSLTNIFFLLPIIAGLTCFVVMARGKGNSFPPSLMNPGVVFFEGNNPMATGHGAAYPPLVSDMSEDFPEESDYQHALYRLVARHDSDVIFNPQEVNSYWSAKAINFITDEPAHALSLLAKKSFYIFHNYRWHDIRAAAMADISLQNSGFIFIHMSLITALAILGLLMSLGRWREYLLLYTVFASQAGLMLVTYASDRQRVTLLPFMIFFALVGLSAIMKSRTRRRLMAIVVLIPLVMVLSIETKLMKDNKEVWANFDQRRNLLQETRAQRDTLQLEQAGLTTARTLAMAPWANMGGAKLAQIPGSPAWLTAKALAEFAAIRTEGPTADFDRSLLLISAGQLTEAEQTLGPLHKSNHLFERYPHRVSIPGFYLGHIAALRGDKTKATALMEQALKETPGDPAILAHLTAITGRVDYAADLESYFGRLNTALILGQAYLENDQPERAADTLKILHRDLPEHRQGLLLLAAALGDAAHDDEATSIFLQAMRNRTEPVMFQNKVIPAFRRWAEASPPEGSPHYWYGKVLLQYGLFAEARDVLQASFDANGRAEVAAALQNAQELLFAKHSKR